MLFFHAVAVDGTLAVGGIHTDENAVDLFDVVIVGALKFPFLLAGHDAAHIVQCPLQYVVTKGGGFLRFLGFPLLLYFIMIWKHRLHLPGRSF
jgi:hypothetical protein